jgi:hypothetical protein
VTGQAEAMTLMRAVIVIMIVTLASSSPALAQTVTCSTSFQGYRVCSSPDGYKSTEWQWQGFTIGDDNRGDKWTSSRWQGFDITTGEPPPER